MIAVDSSDVLLLLGVLTLLLLKVCYLTFDVVSRTGSHSMSTSGLTVSSSAGLMLWFGGHRRDPVSVSGHVVSVTTGA